MVRLITPIGLVAALLPVVALAQAGSGANTSEKQLNSEPIPADLHDILSPVAPKFAGTAADAKQLGALVANPKDVPLAEIMPEVWQALKPGQALQWYVLAAEAGNVDAMTLLSRMYADGVVLPVAPAKATGWFAKSAASGQPAGQCAAAISWLRGYGVARDVKRGRSSLGKSAVAYPAAMNEMGVIAFAGGSGNPPDPAAALEWFNKGVTAGNANAMDNLGNLYVTGNGVPQDLAKAVALFQQSTDAGSAKGKYDLGFAYYQGLGGLPHDAQKAVDLWCLSADEGYPKAIANLGAMYEGREGGIVKNASLAADLYLRAAQLGEPLGMMNLAQLLYDGNGVTKDRARAIELMKAADHAGLPDAKAWLAAHPGN
jgi:uncharacterized protein